MSLLDLKTALSRRGVLKGITAVVSTGLLSGCGSNDDGSNTEADIMYPDNNFVMDKNVQIRFNTGPYNCGGRCAHKFVVKNDRVLKMTSDGDTLRSDCEADEYAGHEMGKPVQHRACVRGYSYIQHNYQPNRLKYPLLQTKERGDASGFKRISWKDATELLSTEVMRAVGRSRELGYIPLLFSAIANAFLGAPCLINNMDASTGGVEGAKYDGVGMNAQCNSRNDRFNTKFLLSWALDPSRTTYFQVNSHWQYQKMKEMGIPVVVITSTMNDTAAMSTTGVSVTIPNDAFPTHSVKGSKVEVPGWLGVRPATDGALMMAMMYIIWKHNMHDAEFLRKHAFGFFKSEEGQSYMSQAPDESRPMLAWGVMDMVLPAPYTDPATGDSYPTNSIYAGKNYKVPVNGSFEYQIEKLEADWAPDAVTAQEKYDGILKYASRLTGMKAEYIEAIAFKYAEPFVQGTGAAMLDVGGGANRADNGAEWAWLSICFASICGYINKPGGGTGFNMLANPDDYAITKPNAVNGSHYTTTYSLLQTPYAGNIHLNGYNHLHLPYTGTDGRTKEQIISDVYQQTAGFDGNGNARRGKDGYKTTAETAPLDISDKIQTVSVLGEPAREMPLQVDVIIHGCNYLTTNPNINKSILGAKAVRFSCAIDNMMTPTALYSDLILPRRTHFEDNDSIEYSTQGTSTIFLRQNMCSPLYEARNVNDMVYSLFATMQNGNNYVEVISPAPTDEELKAEYEKFAPTELYYKYNHTMPTWEEFKARGYWEAQAPSSDSIIGFRDNTPPADRDDPSSKGLENTTGLINFHSPFWEVRMNMEGKGSYNSGRFGIHKASEDVAGYDEFSSVERAKHKFRGPGWRVSTAQYYPPREGYERFFEDNNPTKKFTGYTSPVSGRTYKLMYLTNKSRNRAHTVFDSTAIVKDQFSQTAKMNPLTASERGIKDGEMVYVYNDRGCTYIPAELTNQVLPGIVSIEHGAWYRAHPSQKVFVWVRNSLTGESTRHLMPVDVGGAENVLTDDDFTYDPVFVCQSLAAQTGPCEVSKTKPEGN